MKTCTRCKLEKSPECFRIRKGPKANKDGLNATCRECDAELNKQYRIKKLESNPLKICNDCGKEKHYSLVSRDRCVDCKNLKKNIEQAKIAANSFEKRVQITETEKRCSKCRLFKTHDSFWKSNTTTDGFYSSCIDCTKISQERCRPARLVAQKKWRDSNKEKQKITWNDWDKNQRKINPEYRLKRIVSCAIRMAITNNTFSNSKIQKLNKAIFAHLPYTAEELKSHIESQWESWMSWDNYGKYDPDRKTWQIDHVKAQSLLPYSNIDDENFQRCWALSNLRPLETIANIKKSNKDE